MKRPIAERLGRMAMLEIFHREVPSFEVYVRFAPRALVSVVDVQSTEQAVAGLARSGVDDDP
jgi:hypothetical protein